MRYLKSHNILIFSKEELRHFLLDDLQKELGKELILNKISLNDLEGNHEKVKEITDKVSNRLATDRDKHEVFAGAFNLVDFYGEDSQICFEMKSGFNPKRDTIGNLDELNKMRNGSVSDVGILSKEQLRLFQLKRYRESLTNEALLKFLTKKIKKYGYNLGEMNLLLILQTPGDDISALDFKKIHEGLKNLNLAPSGWVLISYNENYKFSVINTVFPKLATTRIPWHPATQEL